jgi:hypothetical protein
MGKLTTLVLVSVVGVGVVPACSGPATPGANAPFADGTRLKAVHYQIDGAPPFFVGWYDSELGVDCSFVFRKLPDHLVCFPSKIGDQPQFAHDAYMFADSGCSQPVVGTYFPGESRYFVRREETTACQATGRLFRVGAELPMDSASFYVADSTGACIPTTVPVPANYSALHVLGAEIPIDTLVSGSLRHDAGPPRIVPLAIAGSDGSMQGTLATDADIIAWDNQREEMVFAPTPLTADSRWYPTFSYSPVFSNATCTALAAVGHQCSLGAKTVSTSTIDVCGRRLQGNFFELGARLGDGAPLYYVDTGACVSADSLPATSASDPAFSIGTPVPLTSFADATEVRTGTEQLRIVQVGSPGGPAMGAIGLRDNVREQPCSAWLADDGTYRCLPPTVEIGPLGFFADAACSVPVLSSPPADDGCTRRPTLASYFEPATASGVSRRHIYPIGDPYVGMLYFLVGGDCLALGAGQGETLVTGPEIPAADLAPMTLVRPN